MMRPGLSEVHGHPRFLTRESAGFLLCSSLNLELDIGRPVADRAPLGVARAARRAMPQAAAAQAASSTTTWPGHRSGGSGV